MLLTKSLHIHTSDICVQEPRHISFFQVYSYLANETYLFLPLPLKVFYISSWDFNSNYYKNKWNTISWIKNTGLISYLFQRVF